MKTSKTTGQGAGGIKSQLRGWLTLARATWRAFTLNHRPRPLEAHQIGDAATIASAVTAAQTTLARLALATVGKFARSWEAQAGIPLSEWQMGEATQAAMRAWQRAFRTAGRLPLPVQLTGKDGSTHASARADIWTREGATGQRERAFHSGEDKRIDWQTVTDVESFARAVWQRAENRARRAMRSAIYGRGEALVAHVSLDAPSLSGREWERVGFGATDTWQGLVTPCGMRRTGRRTGGTGYGTAQASIQPVANLAAESENVSVALVAFWGKKGGERWQSALRNDLRKVDAMREVAARRGLVALEQFGWLVDERRTKKGAAKSECSAKLHLDAHLMRARIAAGVSIIVNEPLRALALVRFAGGFIATDARQAEAWEAAAMRTHERLAETDPAETDPAETDPAETDPAETDPAETISIPRLASMRGLVIGLLNVRGEYGAAEVWQSAGNRSPVATDAGTMRTRLALARMRAELAEQTAESTRPVIDNDARILRADHDTRRVALATGQGASWPEAARSAEAAEAARVALVAVTASRSIAIGARVAACAHAALTVATVGLSALVLVSRSAASATRAARAAEAEALASMSAEARAARMAHLATRARITAARDAAEAARAKGQAAEAARKQAARAALVHASQSAARAQSAVIA